MKINKPILLTWLIASPFIFLLILMEFDSFTLATKLTDIIYALTFSLTKLIFAVFNFEKDLFSN